MNISFFIPAYNCEQTIEESIESILKTNFREGDELIIVNDGSTDKTHEVLNKYQNGNQNIKVIKHSYNKGGGAARNTCIEHCSHDILFCLDSDNILGDNSIFPLLDYLLKTSADVAAFQHLYYFTNGTENINDIWTLPTGVFNKQDCLSRNFSPGSSGNYMFLKTSWLKAGGYPEFAGALDTWGFGLRQLMTGSKMVVLEDSYYFHRHVDNSYYLRDAWARKKSISLRGLQLLIPYIDSIHEDDLDYIFSKKARFTWMDNLDNRPIRITNKVKSHTVWGPDLLKTPSWKKAIKRILKYK